MSASERTIVETLAFTRQADKIFNQNEKDQLLTLLYENPSAGQEIPGLHGARKLRFAVSGRGKRGGARVIYYHHYSTDEVFAIAVYTKAAKSDLTPAERRKVLTFVKAAQERRHP